MLQIILSLLDDNQRDFVSRLFYKYEKRVKRYANSILQQDMDAEDCVINTFVKVMDYIDKYNETDEEYVEHLLFVICKREAIDMYRRKRRDWEQLVPLTYYSEDGELEEKDLVDLNENIHRIAISNYTQELVRKLLKEMDPKYSVVLVLRYKEAMTNRQIAEVMNITESAVGTRLARAKQYLVEKGGEELYDLIQA